MIANGKFYIEKVFTKFKFKYFTTIGLGKWTKTFKLKRWKNCRHKTLDSKNYGDYYPMYYINHKYAQWGVSNHQINPQEIYEITYDHLS